MGRRGTLKKVIFSMLILFVVSMGVLNAQEGEAEAPGRIDMDQFNAEEELKFGVNAFHDGAYNKALLSFEKSLAFNPEFRLAEEWLARTYYRNGQTSVALEIWARLLEQEVLGAAMTNMISTIRYRRERIEGTEVTEPKYVEFHRLEGAGGEVEVFKRPTSVVPSVDGGFYVVSFADNEVLKFSMNGTLKTTIRGGIEGLNHPFDMTVHPELGLFITEFSSDRIVRCTPRGRVLARFGGTGTGEGLLLGPQFITDDRKGYLYVTDQGNRRVSKFDYGGNYILSFGGVRGELESLNEPTGIHAVNDVVYVADKKRAEILVFDESGNFIRSIGNDYLEQPEGISTYKPGQLLVADENKVLLFDIETESFFPLVLPEGPRPKVIQAARDMNDNLLLADFNQNSVSMHADFSRMYSGLFVSINQVNSDRFPKIFLDLTVERRDGSPFIGLEQENFYLTEGRYAVEGMSLEGAVDQSNFAEVSLLIEGSELMGERINEISRMVAQLTDELLPEGLVHVVLAGLNPVMQVENSGDPQVIRAAALRGSFSSEWRFDQGLRLAVPPLLSGGERRAVVFLNSGRLAQNAFDSYELIHLADYLLHNNVTFYSVTTDPEGTVSPEVQFLCDRTGGENVYLYNPKGVAPVVKSLRSSPSGRYILSFQTGRESDFGRNYLPVEVQVSIFGRSGRSEMGYYAPPGE